jgi:hypothetical protein
MQDNRLLLDVKLMCDYLLFRWADFAGCNREANR